MSHQRTTRDEVRRVHGRIVINASAEDRKEGRARIPKEEENKFVKLFNDFIQALNDLDANDRQRIAAIEERNTKVRTMLLGYRVFLNVSEFRSERLALLPSEIRQKLVPLSPEERPKTLSNERWRDIVDGVIDAELRAIEMGIAPITEPTVEELVFHRDEAQEAFDHLRALKLAQSELQELVSKLRVLLDRRLMKIRLMIKGDCLEKGLANAATREVLRNYGFVYRKPRTPAPTGQNQTNQGGQQGEGETNNEQNTEQNQETEGGETEETPSQKSATDAKAAVKTPDETPAKGKEAAARQAVAAKTPQAATSKTDEPDPLTELEELFDEFGEEEDELDTDPDLIVDHEALSEELEREDEPSPYRPDALSLESLLRQRGQDSGD